jgi:hypothetical protein
MSWRENHQFETGLGAMKDPLPAHEQCSIAVAMPYPRHSVGDLLENLWSIYLDSKESVNVY